MATSTKKNTVPAKSVALTPVSPAALAEGPVGGVAAKSATPAAASISTTKLAEALKPSASPVAKVAKASVKKAAAPKKKAVAKKAAKPKAEKMASVVKKVSSSRTKSNFGMQTNETMEMIMTQGKTQFDKLTQDSAAASKESLDVLMKSTNVFMKGYEDLWKTCMSLAQSSAEKNSQAVKQFLGCKTLNELTEAQNKFAQQNFDDFMSGVTKLSELSVKVSTEAFEPINDQVNKSIKKASESMAA